MICSWQTRIWQISQMNNRSIFNQGEAISMEEISLKIFGTTDYESVLKILPPYDGLVKQFYQEVEKRKEALES